MSDTALEAVLRRDRAVVIVALAVITVLAWADLVWLADDMAMGGMDMTGYRMIPAGRGLMMPADAPWQPIEFGYVFVMWVGDDDRHDDAVGRADDSDLRARRAAGGGAGQAVRRKRLVRRRLSSGLDRVLAGRDVGAMGARARSAADADDGERQQQARRLPC